MLQRALHDVRPAFGDVVAEGDLQRLECFDPSPNENAAARELRRRMLFRC